MRHDAAIEVVELFARIREHDERHGHVFAGPGKVRRGTGRVELPKVSARQSIHFRKQRLVLVHLPDVAALDVVSLVRKETEATEEAK